MILVPDTPVGNVRELGVRNLLGGTHRGHRKQLRDVLNTMKEHGYEAVLRRHPCPPIGNPRIFHHQGFHYTFAWLKHAYFVGLMTEKLGGQLKSDFIAMDIGSSYGMFSSLVKGEYPGSRHVLVDFPEQLLLAYYFLSTYMPEASIAGITQVSTETKLNRQFIEEYDFVLVPCSYYQNLVPESIDLISNFTSFGEMSRKWFDHYLTSPVFLTAKNFFTSNRVETFPGGDMELTILDYPIWDATKRLHFQVCPLWSTHYERRNLFFSERVTHSPHFEYIGEI